MKLIILFLVSTSLFAREGLYLLNSFPDSERFVELGIDQKSYEIDVDELTSSSYSEVDKEISLTALYGLKLNEKSYATISIPYTHTEENSLRYGSARKNNYVFSGFREPRVAYARRLSHKKTDGDYYTDMQVGLRPGIFQRKTGSDDANNWSGSTVADLEFSTGALYEKYEARIRGKYEYYSWSRGENLNAGKDYTTAPYYVATVFLDLQYLRDESWLFFLGSGVSFTSDYDIKTSSAKSTIQQGTGSTGEIGSKYLLQDSFYTLKLTFQRNDYFTSSHENGNFQGGFTMTGFNFAWTKSL